MAEPLFLKATMHDKIWGGTRLREEYGYDIPTETTGEYWAISAHPHGVSTVENGSFAGFGLDRLYQEHPELFGYPNSTVFPLLTKILDANDWLSVQVHPDDAYARKHEGELGKTECWYILAAERGAEIIYGHTAKSRQELTELIEAGNWDQLLTRVPVKAGDFFYVPSGTMHAIGKGIMVLETQQSSDTTYRVYDFDRKDAEGKLRPLHFQQSIDVMTIGKPQNSHPDRLAADDLTVTFLVANDFFTVYKWEIDGTADMRRLAPYYLLSVIDGKGNIVVDGQDYQLQKGQHFILPYTVDSWKISGQLELIVSHIS
ncbi:mannose-6-phosphate isomerase, class I [Streptococcus dentapri]|uniref:Mannose-6-phosphate isomerase n=1 Tax=Streptococcus dentapri TaxID=573564 RepID=A0ABV8D0Q3_9STRE